MKDGPRDGSYFRDGHRITIRRGKYDGKKGWYIDYGPYVGASFCHDGPAFDDLWKELGPDTGQMDRLDKLKLNSLAILNVPYLPGRPRPWWKFW